MRLERLLDSFVCFQGLEIISAEQCSVTIGAWQVHGHFCACLKSPVPGNAQCCVGLDMCMVTLVIRKVDVAFSCLEPDPASNWHAAVCDGRMWWWWTHGHMWPISCAGKDIYYLYQHLVAIPAQGAGDCHVYGIDLLGSADSCKHANIVLKYDSIRARGTHMGV